MEYVCSVIINKPIQVVVDLWDNKSNYKNWIAYFSHVNYVSGLPGMIDSVSEIIYNYGNSELILKETILHNNLPHEKTVLIEVNGDLIEQGNSFVAIDENRTEYIQKIKHLKTKLQANIFFSGVQKKASMKQNKKILDSLKKYIESQ